MASRSTAKKAVARRPIKKRERWTWNKQSQYALDCLRELVATGKPLPSSVNSDYGYAVDQILGLYRQWIMTRSIGDSTQNSVGAKVKKWLERVKGKDVVAKQFRKAQHSSRRASFDCVVRASLISRGGMVSDELNDAVLKRDFVEDPNIIEWAPEARELFVRAVERGRSNYLRNLAADMENYDERRDKIDVNDLLAEVARHWTDCHCPMWLMSRKAILNAAKAFAPKRKDWNEESLKRVFRDVHLDGSDVRPIEDVITKDGKIEGFLLRPDVFNCLGATEVTFEPAGSSITVTYRIAAQPSKTRKAGVRVKRGAHD